LTKVPWSTRTHWSARAQIGKRVHLSEAAQIGGVLEPINISPVIIEEDVLVGGNCVMSERWSASAPPPA
jgi:tetrahydrodipicolinate N-succinyltransferase